VVILKICGQPSPTEKTPSETSKTITIMLTKCMKIISLIMKEDSNKKIFYFPIKYMKKNNNNMKNPSYTKENSYVKRMESNEE
jgi:hypothetical protein